MTFPRILIVNNHAMFRAGLRMVLAAASPAVRIVEVATIEEAMRPAPEDIDVVLLDFQSCGGSGLRRAPVVILSSEGRPETVSVAFARGAAGFISRIETAIDPPGKNLTLRQREVLAFLHQGLSNKLIARRLGLSSNTVRRHVQDILRFYSATNRAEAVFAACRRGDVL